MSSAAVQAQSVPEEVYQHHHALAAKPVHEALSKAGFSGKQWVPHASGAAPALLLLTHLWYAVCFCLCYALAACLAAPSAVMICRIALLFRTQFWVFCMPSYTLLSYVLAACLAAVHSALLQHSQVCAVCSTGLHRHVVAQSNHCLQAGCGRPSKTGVRMKCQHTSSLRPVALHCSASNSKFAGMLHCSWASTGRGKSHTLQS